MKKGTIKTKGPDKKSAMKRSTFNFSAAHWKLDRERLEYETKIFSLIKRDMTYPAENLSGCFYTLDSPDWINVVALSADDEIILVEQYRFGIAQTTLELPGGMVDPGEDSLTTAKRETLEETGFHSDHWESLGKVSSNPAIQTNYTHTFLATGCYQKQAQRLGPHEFIKVHLLPLEEFLELARQGVIHHALVLAAIAKYLLIKR